MHAYYFEKNLFTYEMFCLEKEVKIADCEEIKRTSEYSEVL
jgi:hypothetical protein